ncbi:hypothetical protein V1478_018405 [Vespula squamosa]|uniref:Uncharacterized protein n=1 Tax=Vespula squamosa TaxID=30214 RepID=A0ABD1ZUY5_VESSQ
MGGWLTEERWKEEPPKDILVKRLCRTLDSDVDIKNDEEEEEESGSGGDGGGGTDDGSDPARWKETFERGSAYFAELRGASGHHHLVGWYEYNQELKPQHECRILYYLLGSPSNPDTLARVPPVESYYQPTFHFEIQGRKFLGLRGITIESKDRKIGLRESEGRTVGWEEGGGQRGVGWLKGKGKG